MTGSDMIHLTATMVILALTHIICLAAMTERRYSVRKTVLLYGVFGVFFRLPGFPAASCREPHAAVGRRFLDGSRS